MGITPKNWTQTPKGKIAREMWAILQPDGEMVLASLALNGRDRY